MKAAVIHKFGGVDVLKYEDIKTPKPKPGHILIKVLAAGVNRFDHYLREGSIVPELPFPHILGSDAAGEVAELGTGVTGFKLGERVIPKPGFPLKEEEYHIRPAATAPSFTLPGLGIPGTYAQYIEIPARWVVKDDTGLKPEEVATLPVVLGTSVRALKEVGAVKAGDKVLVHSGASGSGSMHIQVAKALGAKIATTVRDDAKGEFAKKAGADLVINTRKDNFVGRVKEWTGGRGADVVIDNLGGEVLPKSIDAVRPQGVVVAYGFAASPEVTFDIRTLFFAEKQLRGSMASDIEDLNWGLEQVRAGRIKPLLDRTLPLSQAAEAHRLISTNQVTGNLVLLPWAE
ncbi:MAG: zinc-binding dehydrogenase [Deltaproteobacteria bacterium]|nr:zinc-binding dehydrogenase [Deltaproteobacteria bacterium]